ncbi:MAG: tetratricopeptide repeat protein [Myxococcaceae bacterium]
MTSSFRILTLALCVGLSASAAPKKKAVKEPAAAKPGTAGAKTADTKKRPEERQGPASLREIPRLEDATREEMADKKRDEAIENLKRIVPRFDDGDPQKADLLYQLSELYWEKSKYLYRAEMTKFQDEEKVYDAARNKGEKVAEPKQEHRQSELFRSETMRLYETILREYPAYQRKDEVLFSLGYNLGEIGKKEQAVARYNELIKNYPTSRFVPDTFIELGNYYFEIKANVPKARENYEKAMASKIPKIYSYALYKLAWCDFNDDGYEPALVKLQKVVDYADSQQKERMTDLKNEALNDMIRVYVKMDRADEAIAYFKRKAAKKRQVRLISKLADQLAEAGHFENAIKSYRYLINDEPMHAAAPEFQQAIVKAFEGLRQREQVKVEVKRLAELYSPGSSWWRANEQRQDVLRNAFTVAEEAMRSIVTDYHQEAQKTKQVATYRLARDIYKQYINAFASSEDESFVSDHAFNLSFYYAEILWALEEWEPAAAAYEKVVAFKVPTRDTAKEVSQEKYRQTAAYDSILAFDKLVKIERGVVAKNELKDTQKVDEAAKKGNVEKQGKIQKRSAKELEEQKLTKFEQKLADACDRYNTSFPNNPDEIDVRYQAAVVYYDRNHFIEAAKRFGEIILKWPEEKRSQEAADLSMFVLESREAWLELNKLSRQFLANKKLAKPGTEFSKRVTGVVEGSQYKYVDETIYKKEKNPAKAAEEFNKFVAEFPQSQNADRALTYAMIIYQDANQLDRGIAAGERVLKEYPGSAFDLKVRYTLANFYEKIADFRKSAEMYEAFIAAYDAAAGAKAVGLDNLKDLRKSEDKVTKGAKAKASKTVAAVPKKDERKSTRIVDPKEREELVKEAEKWVADAQFNAGLWWEGLGQSDKAISAYTLYLTRFKDRKDVPEIAFNIGLIHEKDKKYAEAVKTFETWSNSYAKDNRASPALHYRAKYRQYLDQKILKNNREEDRLQEDLLKSFARLPETAKKEDQVLNAYAAARFAALDPLWAQYTGIKFVKVSTIKKDLAAKVKRIQDVEKAYTDVLAVGAGEYGIAALTRIGLAYSDFAQNLLDSPDPRGLNDEQLSMYRSELENRAFPLEEKAIEALEKALAKSYELSIYNEWTLAAQDKVNKYRPGAYSKVRDVAYRGSEFFATSPVLKESGLAEAPASSAAQPATTASAEAR